MSIYVVPSFYPDGPENAPADCGRDDMPTAFIVYDDADESDVRIVKIFDNRNDADKFVADHKAAREVGMTRERALPYVSYCVDDALAERTIAEMPPHARLVGWQCGFEPLFVAVWSYLSDDRLDPCEAEELATYLLIEKKWFTDNDDPPSADYVI